MANNIIPKKLYSKKRPSHPADCQTNSKRFFKRKGRKMVRQYLKKQLNRDIPPE